MSALAAPKPASDLAVRTGTGIVLITVAVGCLVYGQTPLWLLVSLATLTMLAEWSAMIGAARGQMWLAMIAVAVPLFLAQPTLDLPATFAVYALIAMTVAIALMTQRPMLAAGMLYAGLPSLALLYLHDQYDGIHLVLWVLAVVCATDIGAYFAGRTIGGAKLAPTISPNKTWAGLIGGMIAAILAGFAVAHGLHLPLRLAAFSGLFAVAAQGGDLYESAMKRRAGVKDSGRILPGHGGAMDRLDGLVPVTCLVALIVVTGVV